MSIVGYTTEPGVCAEGKHEITDIKEPTARLGYTGARVVWEGASFTKRRLCRKHYLADFAERFPDAPLPELP